MKSSGMVLEGIVTTANADGSTNIAPMGPIVDEQMQTLLLRPYHTSTTYQNLKRVGEGIFHVTDNVEMLARAAIGKIEPEPELIPCDVVHGMILADACRWHAFRVSSLDDREPRTTIAAHVLATGRRRDFIGFNRAKHACVEAAILATRVEILSADEIRREFERLAVWVRKTGGEQERRAFALLNTYVEEAFAARRADEAGPFDESGPPR